MLNHGVTITSRVRLPEGTTLLKGTKIELCWKRFDNGEERFINLPNNFIGLYFQLSASSHGLVLNTDRHLNWGDLPTIYKNKKGWEEVRRLIAKGWAPDYAYLDVSLKQLQQQWKFAMINKSSEKAIGLIHLEIDRHGPAISNIVAHTDYVTLGAYFKFDEKRFSELVGNR